MKVFLGLVIEIILVVVIASVCAAVVVIENKDRISEIKIKDQVNGDPKITIRLSSGEKLYPSRAHVHPEHVQAIMPDGTAITMAWKQVDGISLK